jgi:hypothetical protein
VNLPGLEIADVGLRQGDMISTEDAISSAGKGQCQSDFGQGAVFGHKRQCGQTPESSVAVNYYYNSPDAPLASLRNHTRF